MSRLQKQLITRLENKGMTPDMISGFIRSLSNLLHADSNISLFQVKKQLQYLGWDDFELDYFTFQLVLECLDFYNASHVEYKTVNWFTDRFSPIPSFT